MEVLSEEIPAAFTAEEVGEAYTQPVCPECSSRDVSFLTFSRGWALVALNVLALPLPVPINKWKCLDCGHRWRAPYD
jgi:transposase-like protein